MATADERAAAAFEARGIRNGEQGGEPGPPMVPGCDQPEECTCTSGGTRCERGEVVGAGRTPREVVTLYRCVEHGMTTQVSIDDRGVVFCEVPTKMDNGHYQCRRHHLEAVEHVPVAALPSAPEAEGAREGQHRLEITIDEGQARTNLICPERGCSPSSTCGRCGRDVDDDESRPCYDCPREASACWLASWYDDADLADFMTDQPVGTFVIDAEYDGESPVVTIIGATPPAPEAREGDGERAKPSEESLIAARALVHFVGAVGTPWEHVATDDIGHVLDALGAAGMETAPAGTSAALAFVAVKCPDCGGSGGHQDETHPGGPYWSCETCGATGYVPSPPASVPVEGDARALPEAFKDEFDTAIFNAYAEPSPPPVDGEDERAVRAIARAAALEPDAMRRVATITAAAWSVVERWVEDAVPIETGATEAGL